MANFFIYSGFALLLAAFVIMLYFSIKEIIRTKRLFNFDFQQKPDWKYLKPFLIIAISGFILIGIGIIIALNS